MTSLRCTFNRDLVPHLKSFRRINQIFINLSFSLRTINLHGGTNVHHPSITRILGNPISTWNRKSLPLRSMSLMLVQNRSKYRKSLSLRQISLMLVHNCSKNRRSLLLRRITLMCAQTCPKYRKCLSLRRILPMLDILAQSCPKSAHVRSYPILGSSVRTLYNTI